MAEEDQRKKKTKNPKSYQGRKECIKTKSMDLATLCDIKVCIVITGPNRELQTWPHNLDACKEVLVLYSQNLKSEKKHKESVPEPEEEQGEKDLLTLVVSKLVVVNRRIRLVENKNDMNTKRATTRRVEEEIVNEGLPPQGSQEPQVPRAPNDDGAMTNVVIKGALQTLTQVMTAQAQSVTTQAQAMTT
ncbi:agamous-like MADS-box protein AGL81 [Solanum stenotomum]|uniref:agamous-like MADS-box protein AGL81 n=1 Tax=Solanum stenotomum TaxID=172797 RepID=UPI0020D17560|nr:agamous-like MADS-box protein AGL81 [Solanum stenotomum]